MGQATVFDFDIATLNGPHALDLLVIAGERVRPWTIQMFTVLVKTIASTQPVPYQSEIGTTSQEVPGVAFNAKSHFARK